MASREISKGFLNDLKEGVLTPLTEKLEKEGLIICFRNNYVNIYYKGGSLYKIEDNKCYEIEFNFGYANKEQKLNYLKKLEEIGFKRIFRNKKNKKGDIKREEFLIAEIPKDNKDDLKKLFEGSMQTLKGFIDTYKEEKELEKKRQQEIIIANSNPNSEFFAYDMEYPIKGGRIDILAIRKSVNPKLRYLVFCELKSTEGACLGKSSVLKHYKDYYDMSQNEEGLKKMKKEAKLAYELYCKLKGTIPEPFDFVTEPKVLFIYTDKARKHMKESVIELDESTKFKVRFK